MIRLGRLAIFLGLAWSALAAASRGDAPASPVSIPASATVAPVTAPAATSHAVVASATQPTARVDVNKLPIQRTEGKSAAKSDEGQSVPPAPTFDPARVALALAAVIGLILFLRWGSRKLLSLPPGGASSHLMQVVARTRLAPRQQLLLVRVGRRMIIIGDSAGRLSGVGQIDDPDEVAAIVGQAQSTKSLSPSISFGQAMKRLGRRFNGDRTAESDDEASSSRFAEDRDLQVDSVTAGRQAILADESHDDSDSNATDEAMGAALRTNAPAHRDESAAQTAVEAARVDILALRARLQEISGRMSGGAEPALKSNGTTG